MPYVWSGEETMVEVARKGAKSTPFSDFFHGKSRGDFPLGAADQPTNRGLRSATFPVVVSWMEEKFLMPVYWLVEVPAALVSR